MSEEKEVEEESKTKGVSREMKRKKSWDKWLSNKSETLYNGDKLGVDMYDVEEIIVRKEGSSTFYNQKSEEIDFDRIVIKAEGLLIELYSKDNEEIDVNIVDTSEDPGSSINLMYDEEVEQNGRIPMAFDRKVIEE